MPNLPCGLEQASPGRATVSWLLLALWLANVAFFCVYFIKLGWTNLP